MQEFMNVTAVKDKLAYLYSSFNVDIIGACRGAGTNAQVEESDYCAVVSAVMKNR